MEPNGIQAVDDNALKALSGGGRGSLGKVMFWAAFSVISLGGALYVASEIESYKSKGGKGC